MAGLTNLKLLTDFFNKIGQKATFEVAPLKHSALCAKGLKRPQEIRYPFFILRIVTNFEQS
jgi:hypothetical protein